MWALNTSLPNSVQVFERVHLSFFILHRFLYSSLVIKTYYCHMLFSDWQEKLTRASHIPQTWSVEYQFHYYFFVQLHFRYNNNNNKAKHKKTHPGWGPYKAGCEIAKCSLWSSEGMSKSFDLSWGRTVDQDEDSQWNLGWTHLTTDRSWTLGCCGCTLWSTAICKQEVVKFHPDGFTAVVPP